MTVTSTTIVRLECDDVDEHGDASTATLELDAMGETMFFQQGDAGINWPIEHAQALIDAIQQVCGIPAAGSDAAVVRKDGWVSRPIRKQGEASVDSAMAYAQSTVDRLRGDES